MCALSKSISLLLAYLIRLYSCDEISLIQARPLLTISLDSQTNLIERMNVYFVQIPQKVSQHAVGCSLSRVNSILSAKASRS